MRLVVETCLFPRRSRFCAITLFGIVFTRDKSWVTPRVLNHERIHCRQQMELLYIPFYIIYVVEWLWHLAKTRDRMKAYRDISFEREAFDHESDFAYLKNRRFYANYRR